MSGVNDLSFIEHQFDSDLHLKLKGNQFVDECWPLVYMLSDDISGNAYIGETTDALGRMVTHLGSESKRKLSHVRLIASRYFNKSATLDIESNLIRYISGDGKWTLHNANLGLANHSYYQKNEVYWGIFKTIWKKLQTEGIVRNSIESINNSDLFKYSPFKVLSYEQANGIIAIIKSMIDKGRSNIIIEGGAGSGKTVMAVYLFKLLNTAIEDLSFIDFQDNEVEMVGLVTKLKEMYPNPKMALVIPMASFRKTIKKVFRNVKGLSSNMVVGPAEIVDKQYDLIIVDEAHRLRQRKNLGAYYGAFDLANAKMGMDKLNGNELSWIIKQGKNVILFYDSGQSIKPSDINEKEFDNLKAKKTTSRIFLKSQFRVRGGMDYVKYIDKILNTRAIRDDQLKMKNYEFLLFESIDLMVKKIKEKDIEVGLSRLVAGYSWQWVSRHGTGFDIEIENTRLRWNSETEDWVNSANAVNEVGCIHTTQGYDLNYAGVIFGNEITYDPIKKEILIIKEKYFDRNGKQTIVNDWELKRYILNIYKTLMLRGIRGTYVYACDRNLRNYLKEYIDVFGSYKLNDISSVAAED